MGWKREDPGRALPGEQIGDLDRYGRELLDPEIIPDPATVPRFGRWRGGLIHPDQIRFVIGRKQHDQECSDLGGWVRSVDWWGRCSICDGRTTVDRDLT